MIKVYIASVLPLYNEEKFNEIYLNLNDVRRKKIDKVKRFEIKAESCGAGMLLKTALEKQGLDYNSLEFETDSYGKPHVLNSDLHFSLSHSKDYVMCVVSSDEIGCDVQKKIKYNPKIISRFAKSEQDFLMNVGEEERENEFFRLWSLKESFIKMKGKGLSIDLSSFEIKRNQDLVWCQDGDYVFYFKEKRVDDYFFSCCSMNEAVNECNFEEIIF